MPGKETNIILRCTVKEKDAIKKLAEDAGESVTSYLLRMAFDEKGYSLKYYKEHSDIKHEILKELKRIGVNINQISTRINSVDQTTFKENEKDAIIELFKTVIELRVYLTKNI